MPSIDLSPMTPKESIEFFRKKGYKTDYFDSNRDATYEQHQNAFMVAKMMQLDILEDTRNQVDKAIADGMSFKDFQKNLETNLTDKGWWGRKVMTDPVTGQDKIVQLGSPKRLKKIYDTNLRHAHSDGQWERIQESKKEFPYLVYDANNSQIPRIEHSHYDGLCLKVDDPFWQEHYPPRGYGCKCRTYSISKTQKEEDKTLILTAPKEQFTTWTNKDTLESLIIPEGVLPEYYYAPTLGQSLYDAQLKKGGINNDVFNKQMAAKVAAGVIGAGFLVFLGTSPLGRKIFSSFTGKMSALLMRFPFLRSSEKLKDLAVKALPYSGDAAIADFGKETGRIIKEKIEQEIKDSDILEEIASKTEKQIAELFGQLETIPQEEMTEKLSRFQGALNHIKSVFASIVSKDKRNPIEIRTEYATAINRLNEKYPFVGISVGMRSTAIKSAAYTAYEGAKAFGGELLSSLLANTKSFTTIVDTSGFGVISETVKIWMTRYAVTEEEFAKIFANIHTLPQKEWGGLERKLNLLLRYVANEKYQYDDYTSIGSLAGAERARNLNYLESMAKNLGLSRFLGIKKQEFK